jgi:hypothetical protein
LDKGFSHYLVLLLENVTLAGQGLQDLDAFALGSLRTQQASQWSSYLESLGILTAKARRLVSEAALLGGVMAKGVCGQLRILSDGAGQFNLLVHALHNNEAESESGEYVTRRQISGGTRSEAGRRARDTFVGLKKTCRKLGLSFWHFLRNAVARRWANPTLT